MTVTPEVPLTPPMDALNITPCPARLNPPHWLNPYRHACPTAHPTTRGFSSPSPRRPIPPSSPCGLNIPPTAYGSCPSAPAHRPPFSTHVAPAGPQPAPDAFGTPHRRC